VREVSPLRIIEYILLVILAVGWAYLTYAQGFAWSRAASIVVPLIVIVLLFIEDRKK
jgi:membrane protein YdbS with pleckstrin-like domain